MNTNNGLTNKTLASRQRNYIIIGFIALFFIFVYMVASPSTKVTLEQNNIQVINTELQTKIISYEVLKSFNPNNDNSALGLEILINTEDVSKRNIVNLVKKLSSDYQVVLVRIYKSREAWDAERNETYGQVYDEGYLVFYVKNSTDRGAYKGVNEIRWFQVSGILEGLFGTKTML